MRYSYEFKLMCVDLYHSGSYPDIPEGANPDTLKRHIREWSGLVDLHGPEVLKHKVFNKVWTPEEKLELVLMVIAKEKSCHRSRNQRRNALSMGIQI